jgi:hypothetical protein
MILPILETCRGIGHCLSFALPLHDGVRLYVEQRATPAVPNSTQTNPEPSIEGRQNRSFTFSLEGCELKAEGSVFHSDCSMTAHQEPNVSKGRQKKGWHPDCSTSACSKSSATGGRNIGESQALIRVTLRGKFLQSPTLCP